MTALPAIDHIVVAVRDLDAAAQQYEALGFTLTPRAQHPDHMGTANRLAQFAAKNFIELLEVDRPGSVAAHNFIANPPHFSFGAHVLSYLQQHQGMTALVLTSDDCRGDAERMREAGLQVYAPFEFSRDATLPDGTKVRVAFTLTFVTDPAMPDIAFYFCQNHFPENFWKPSFQNHANGAVGLHGIHLIAADPQAHAAFFESLIGGRAQQSASEVWISLSNDQILTVSTPQQMRQSLGVNLPERRNDETVLFAGVDIATNRKDQSVVAPSNAAGLFLRWTG